MYSIQTSLGFVIDSRPYGEAGRIFFIFTRDLGLVQAVAQGIRSEKSKLRYHVRLYELAEFSFVKGKDVWRLTNASSDSGKTELPLKGMEFAARMALLLKRLVHGDSPHPEIFEDIKEALEYVRGRNVISSEFLQILESVTVFRILNSLGYVGNVKEIQKGVISDKISDSFLQSQSVHRKEINQLINSALRATQL